MALYLLPFSGATRPVAAAAPATPVAATSIACLGRIEPGDGVVRLAARSLSGQPAIVGTLLVAERDQVKAGQVLVELDSVPQLRATTLLFEAHVEAARKRLEQVKAGAKGSDIAAQRAEIERVDTELENAQKDLRRYQGLRETKSVSDSALDAVRLKVDTLAKVRQQAAQRLTSLSEVRPVDVDVAKAELEASIREVALARTQYDAALIRAPLDGRVVKVHAWPGEQVGPAGVIEIAKTDRMYVLAEIAEGDMARVKAGQRATVTGHGLPGSLTGTVESVGMQVTQNSVLKVDPAEFSDARVVEAKIRLDGGERVAQLIHLRVNVLIESGPSSSGRRDGQ
ncbi:MAG: HlyD family efflux transporter periplasmic adaptor subunit [Acidobacteriota bacterium]